jgi:hypothetical protein
MSPSPASNLVFTACCAQGLPRVLCAQTLPGVITMPITWDGTQYWIGGGFTYPTPSFPFQIRMSCQPGRGMLLEVNCGTGWTVLSFDDTPDGCDGPAFFFDGEFDITCGAYQLQVNVGPCGQPSGPLLWDEFDDADNTPLPLHLISPINQPHTSWINLQGTYIVLGDFAQATSSGHQSCYAACNPGVSDCTVSVDLTFNPNADGQSLLFRASGPDDYFVARLGPPFSLPGFYIVRVTGGSITNVAMDPTFVPIDGQTYNVQVVLSGPNINATVAGGHPLSWTDTFNQLATMHGLASDGFGANSAKFKNFVVTV